MNYTRIVIIKRGNHWGTIGINGRWYDANQNSLTRVMCFLIDCGLPAGHFSAFVERDTCTLDVTVENDKISLYAIDL